ncbi:MAG: endo-1,4-beta-xylanase, partial [Muribaculaceae bacterium]|nr:endo-1,4-beta-xylanase [Muribaculaceae bacterium]
MKKHLFLYFYIVALTASCSSSNAEKTSTVKDHFKDDFLIGAAIPVRHVNGEDPKADSIVSLHFNSIVAENCMKNAEIQPKEGEFFWDDADKFVKYGEDRDMAIIGHALVWHSQLARWFAKDKDGNDVSPEVLKQRMKDHISAVVGRYKG